MSMSTAENANSFQCTSAPNETKTAQLFISESREICAMLLRNARNNWKARCTWKVKTLRPVGLSHRMPTDAFHLTQQSHCLSNSMLQVVVLRLNKTRIHNIIETVSLCTALTHILTTQTRSTDTSLCI